MNRILKISILCMLCAASLHAAGDNPLPNAIISGESAITGGNFTIQSGATLAAGNGSTVNLSAATVSLPADVTRLGSLISLASEVDGALPWTLIVTTGAEFDGDTGSGGTIGLVPAPAAGDAVKFLKGNGTWALPSGTTTFTGLTDTPDSYSGQSLKVVRVNSGETALEFGVAAGGIDWASAPAASDSAGTAGEIAYDADYLYLAVSSGTWKRAALSVFGIDNSYSLNFNGTTAYVALGASIAGANSDFTIEAWVKASAVGFNAIFGAYTSASNYWMLINRSDSQGLCIQYDTGGGANYIMGSATRVETADGWTHVALVRSGSNWTIYKAGTAIKTATNSIATLSSGNQTIGALGSPGSYWAGSIDEVRVWNVAQTGAGIVSGKDTQINAGASGLVGYWRFNDGTGTTAIDAKTTNNGTLSGSTLPSWQTDTPF